MDYSDIESSSDSDNDSYVKSTSVKKTEKYPDDVDDVDDIDIDDDDDDMYDEDNKDEDNKDEEKDKILNQLATNEDVDEDVGDVYGDEEAMSGLKEDAEYNDDDEEDDDDDDDYLQKFNNNIAKNVLLDFHPECKKHNYDEISKLTQVTRDAFGIICNDPFHKTNPFLTIYEKARILGQRATQINSGSLPMVKIPETMIDSQLIAELELEQKKIPFIIKRTVPGGCVEYWKVSDLENIHY